jgi:beta-glucosidase
MINAREEHDRPDIRLPQSQTALLESVCEANDKTILYLITGYPFSIVKEKDRAGAVLVSTHLGPCLGHVAAKTIFGENVPAGRTPTTWYQSARRLPSIEDYDIIKNETTYLYHKDAVLYPFGYGLSYSGFAYTDAALE